LKDINLGDNCLNYIARVADSCNFEICGFIADSKIFFIENEAENKLDHFSICPQRYVEHYGSITCMFHSHVYGGVQLSEPDISCYYESLIPQLVYSKIHKNFLFYDADNEKQFIFAFQSV
tara:strand:+ start:4588 stop:4947 length:360 start_codon:yes stop_codon:yes gene_type:complete